MRKLKKQEVIEVLDKLKIMYPDASCELLHKNEFELLVAVMLSAQTTDKSVNAISPNLFSVFPDAHSLANAEISEVEAIIKRIGLYKTKAKNIVNMSKIIFEDYEGKVPKSYEKLIELPGVGRKTANVVLSVAFNEPRIAVDTHVFRISNRIGIVKENDVLKTEIALLKSIPKERWTEAHHSIIFHGRNLCKARKPECDSCIINDICRYYKENKGK